MDNIKSKKCSRCGKQFGCQTEGNCWCSELQLGENQLKYLHQHYQNCLCKECLIVFDQSKHK